MKAFGRSARSSLVLVLCALFFLLAMGLTLLSSGVYRAVAAQADETYAQRTALSYLVNQVRRSDAPGGVSVGRFGDSDALFLREEGYVTILYCYEGQLRELYMEDGLELSPADGVDVLPLERLELACGGGRLTIAAAGRTVTLYPRCGVEQEGAG